jgi:hypothetical protein
MDEALNVFKTFDGSFSMAKKCEFWHSQAVVSFSAPIFSINYGRRLPGKRRRVKKYLDEKCFINAD